jgi:hypothetical protein
MPQNRQLHPRPRNNCHWKWLEISCCTFLLTLLISKNSNYISEAPCLRGNNRRFAMLAIPIPESALWASWNVQRGSSDFHTDLAWSHYINPELTLPSSCLRPLWFEARECRPNNAKLSEAINAGPPIP